MTQEKNLLLRILKKTHYLGLKDDPITGDPKENPMNEKPEDGPITMKPKDNSTNEDPQELQDPQ